MSSGIQHPATSTATDTSPRAVHPSAPARYIAVEGATGAGKTTLVKRLAVRLGTQVLVSLDPFEENPFLPLVYRSARDTAPDIPNELTFLALRITELRRIAQHLVTNQEGLVLADWSMLKQTVFATLSLPAADLTRIRLTQTTWSDDLPQPELIIHLRASVTTLMERIAQRGRPMESGIDRHDLTRLNTEYDRALDEAGLPVLAVDTDTFNVFDDHDLDLLVTRIRTIPLGGTRR